MKPADERYRVLHIITRLDRGGSAENTLLTVLGLDKGYYQVSLVTGSRSGIEQETKEKLEREGIRVAVFSQLVREPRPWKDLCALWQLCWFIVRGRYHIVHTHTSKAGIVGRWAARLARAPIIIHTPHGHIFYGYYGRVLTGLFAFIERITASFSDAIITLTSKGRDEHLSLGIGEKSKFRVIHSGVDIKRYMTVSVSPMIKLQELSLPRRAPVILSVGRLEPIKGHRYLIMAAPSVLREFPDAYFLLAGNGPLMEELKALACDLRVDDRVKFLGTREDVPELLSICELFALPSLNEGMGRVLVEAMAAGKALVATRVGGVPELVLDGENGLVIEPRDPIQMASAIIRLLKDDELRLTMGEKGRSIAEKYTAEEMVRKIDELYMELLGKHGYVKRNSRRL